MSDAALHLPAPSASRRERLASGLRWASWLACGLCMFVLVTQPVSVSAQAALSLAVVAGLIVIGQLPRAAWSRYLFLALGSAVLLRYLYWRVTATLPPLADPVGFGFGVVLLGAELFCAFVLAISLIINADPLRRKALPREDDATLPSVDVFIPSYNEDEAILAMTVAAAKAMDYPAEKLTVWLLDDGGTDQKCDDGDEAKAAAARRRRVSLQTLCRELGAVYLTRTKNEHAKAGNLNNGLAHSKAEIVVVFDADHAPFRQFLRETVGHFARDPKLFLVQTPHVFLNPDPIEKNLRTFQRMPSENEMFYGVTQRGLDKWNGSFFCGSAALLRRAALKTTGGFSGITITEDCETAFELHAQGWTSLYVDKPLIAGLQPETFASFIGQRSRWCQGMFQILMLKNPALRKGLKPIQRIAYLSSMTFWFFPVPRLIFMVAPLLHIFFDVKIFVSSVDETIAYTLSYVAVNMVMQSYLYGHVRWPWMSELYEYVQGVFLARAIVSVIASPRKPTFNVTAKGLSLENDHLSELAWPFFAIFALLALGVGTAVFRYLFEPGVTALMLVVGLWTGFNLLIAGVALGAVAERRQADRHPRLAIARRGRLIVAGQAIPVSIENVSAGGCAITTAALPKGMNLEARETMGLLAIEPLAGNPERAPVAVRLSRVTQIGEATQCGLAFAGLATRDYPAVAELMYGDAGAIQRFLEGRRKPIGLVRGSARFALWGVTEPFRAVAYAFRERPVATEAPAQAESARPQPVPAFDPASFAAAIQALAAPLHLPETAPARLDQASWFATITALSASARPERSATAPLLAGAA
jgi:cellulose synthase (UDP-forming)